MLAFLKLFYYTVIHSHLTPSYLEWRVGLCDNLESGPLKYHSSTDWFHLNQLILIIFECNCLSKYADLHNRYKSADKKNYEKPGKCFELLIVMQLQCKLQLILTINQ